MMISEKMTNLFELRKHQINLDEAVQKFNHLIENLVAITSTHSEYDVPVPEIDYQAHVISFEVAETRIECRYSYKGKHSVLSYGFVCADGFGKESFHESSKQYYDSAGNLLTKKDGEISSYAMQLDDGIDGFFYAEILQALEASWRHQDIGK